VSFTDINYTIIVLIEKVPNLCEDLLSSVDQPLKIARDRDTGKDYLLCDYNRDGDSYRSLLIDCLSHCLN
jgi:capping protein beta